MFDGKRPSELTIADINKLCADEWPESDRLELKQQPPGKGSAPDPWRESRALPEGTRNKLLEELVAFANSAGGWLVIGIAETETHPKRAASINLLPECSDLADRLSKACRDCIEPQLPFVEIHGIQADEDGEGVVVAYVGKSRSAPHRLVPTRECLIRRQDRCEKMTMREIQDLTISLQRSGDRINTDLQSASKELSTLLSDVHAYEDLSNFHDRNVRDPSIDFGSTFGVRATAIPVTDVYLDDLDQSKDRFLPLHKLTATSRDQPVELLIPVYGADAVPMLRGMRLTSARQRNDWRVCERDIYRDGKIDFRLAVRSRETEVIAAHSAWVLGLTAYCLIALENFRNITGQPGVEYALQVELQVTGDAIQVEDYFNSISRRPWITDDHFSGIVTLPIVSITSFERFNESLALIEQDFFNAAGLEWPRSLRVDFVDHFKPRADSEF